MNDQRHRNFEDDPPGRKALQESLAAADRDLEPAAATDEAILAASRRAVGARPERLGWAARQPLVRPLATAALLVLSVGIVTLLVEQDDAALPPARPASVPVTAPAGPVAPAADAAARRPAAPRREGPAPTRGREVEPEQPQALERDAGNTPAGVFRSDAANAARVPAAPEPGATPGGEAETLAPAGGAARRGQAEAARSAALEAGPERKAQRAAGPERAAPALVPLPGAGRAAQRATEQAADQAADQAVTQASDQAVAAPQEAGVDRAGEISRAVREIAALCDRGAPYQAALERLRLRFPGVDESVLKRELGECYLPSAR